MFGEGGPNPLMGFFGPGGPYPLVDLDQGVQIHWGVQIYCDTGSSLRGLATSSLTEQPIDLASAENRIPAPE